MAIVNARHECKDLNCSLRGIIFINENFKLKWNSGKRFGKRRFRQLMVYLELIEITQIIGLDIFHTN